MMTSSAPVVEVVIAFGPRSYLLYLGHLKAFRPPLAVPPPHSNIVFEMPFRISNIVHLWCGTFDLGAVPASSGVTV